MIQMKSGMLQNIWEQPDVLAGLVQNAQDYSGFKKDVLSKENIFIVGTGGSLNGALACVTAFAKYAGRVPVVLPASEIGYYTHLFNEKSAVVLISQSGESFETKQMCHLMAERGLPFWGLTNEEGSTLATMATKTLLMGAGKEVSSATKTYTATVMLLYLVAAADSEAAMTHLARIPACVEQTLLACQSKIEAVANILLKEKAMVVLADNINGASARASALLLKEKNLIMAEGMTASEFRHGAVEVIEKGLQVLYHAPCDQNRGETLKHIDFLQKTGCDITFVSTDKPATIAEERFLPVFTPGEDVFTHISAILPSQLLTERLARMQGLDVDNFRYLTKIVGNY